MVSRDLRGVDLDRIREVRIAWIRTQLEKIGPHKGDRLVAIDGKQMEGLRLEELKELLHINPAIGETRIFSFEGRRGLLRKRVYPELTFTGVDKTKRAVSASTGPALVPPAN